MTFSPSIPWGTSVFYDTASHMSANLEVDIVLNPFIWAIFVSFVDYKNTTWSIYMIFDRVAETIKVYELTKYFSSTRLSFRAVSKNTQISAIVLDTRVLQNEVIVFINTCAKYLWFQSTSIWFSCFIFAHLCLCFQSILSSLESSLSVEQQFVTRLQDTERWILQTSFRLMSQNKQETASPEVVLQQRDSHRVSALSLC